MANDVQTNRNPRRRRKKRSRVGTVIFWLFYVLLIAGFCLGVHFGLNFLEGWLTDYEAAQPEVKRQQVFQELFADPDWEKLYTMAGTGDTAYEGAASYAAYMEKLVGGDELTCYETSAGLSGNRKYVVKHGNDKVAVFTLTPDSQAENVTDIVQWSLGTVEIFFESQQSVTVCTRPDRTVYINGVALTEDHTIRTLSTAAEEYLPEGVHGLQLRWQYTDGLLVPPQVTAADSEGNAVELQYDEQRQLYYESVEEMTATEDEIETVVNAAKVYSRFMIEETTENTLRRYFDETTSLYRSIVRMDTWMQNHNGYKFSDYTVDGYYRYTDDLYSIHIAMTLYVTRGNGSVKEYPLDTTFFFTKNDKDKWLVTGMNNMDLQEQTEQVRLRFVQDGMILEDQMTAVDAQQLTPPSAIIPEGKVFSGWYQQLTDEKGNVTMSLVFTPDESGTVWIPEGTTLEPMTLYALFDAKEAE